MKVLPGKGLPKFEWLFPLQSAAAVLRSAPACISSSAYQLVPERISLTPAGTKIAGHVTEVAGQASTRRHISETGTVGSQLPGLGYYGDHSNNDREKRC